MDTLRDYEATEHLQFLDRVASGSVVPEQGAATVPDVVVCSFEVGTEESPDTTLEHVRELLEPTGHAVHPESAPEPGRVVLAAVSRRPDAGALRRLRRAGFDVRHAEWFLLADVRETLRGRRAAGSCRTGGASFGAE